MASNLTALVSVVMPVYNGGRYVDDAIGSILTQTHKRIELIIIDDGSIDNTVDIISKHAARDSRIKVISRKNRGLVASLNEGIAVASGDYIARMDADDIAFKERISEQLCMFQERPEIDVIGAQVISIDCNGRVIEQRLNYATGHQEIEFRLLFGSAFAHPTVMAKASILKKHEYQEPTALIGELKGGSEDYYLWVRLAIANCIFANTSNPLLFYRISPGQYSRSFVQAQQLSTASIAAFYAETRFNICRAHTLYFGFSRIEEKPAVGAATVIDYVKRIIDVGDRLNVSNRSLAFALHKIAVRMPSMGGRAVALLWYMGRRRSSLITMHFVCACLYKIIPKSKSEWQKKVLLKVARSIGFNV